MKLKTLLVLAGVSPPLIASASADAGFVGLKVVKKIPNPFGILTINVYAEFDNMGNDWFHGAAGTPYFPLTIGVVGGTFWNHFSGDDTAPPQGLINLYPSLAFDSFYTIGLKAIPMGGSDETTVVNMPTLGDFYGPFVTSVSTTNGSWAIVPPTDTQGNPWDPDSGGGAGQVLIGQYSTANGIGFYGNFLIKGTFDGIPGTQVAVSFAWPAPGTLGLLGLAGLISTRRRRR
ncbi:MAG: PEP-CTERM sorting domain-containing protein [Planctomycetota bacterium]|jgi:MYXO-CTERM domain-containing protein